MTNINTEQLLVAAVKSIKTTPGQIKPTVVLKMSGKWGILNTRFLAGKNSPKGDIVKEDSEGVYVIFDSIDILAWCMAKLASVDNVTLF